MIDDNDWQNQSITALRLNKELIGIDPLKCMDYKFNSPLECFTFGYPPVRKTEGTLVKVSVHSDVYAESYKKLEREWNLDLIKEDVVKDFKGVSGAPLILKNKVVGVILQQSQENGDASRLAAVSFTNWLIKSGIICSIH